jgi:phosphoribosylamine--glycine ligase
MWCAPGNAGIAQERLATNDSPVECINLGAEDLAGLLHFALEQKAELTVVGPDNPLALGIVDLFQANRLRIWGPNRKAAQFEASKVFSQRFMEQYGIPTARAGTFDEPGAARAFATSLGGRCAVKADGLALGKGVLICANMGEANQAIEEILVGKTFGAAGSKIVIQEFLEGPEISLHALCDAFPGFPGSQASFGWRPRAQYRRHGHILPGSIFERSRAGQGGSEHPRPMVARLRSRRD